MSIWKQLNFQDSNSPIMEMLIMFHDYAMMIILIILMFIMYMFIFMLNNKFMNLLLLEHQMLEMIWTIIPMFMLLFLAIPSLKILYMIDESMNSMLSIKILGHQWYWSYEFNDFKSFEFDSFMINDLNKFRLLEVDNRLVLPNKINIRMLVSSNDVIHSFTIPSLGIKVDSIPGRINQMNMITYYSGLFYGQCSEICGINHSFMPIVLEITNLMNFNKWIKNMIEV